MDQSDENWLLQSNLLRPFGNPERPRIQSIIGREDRGQCPKILANPFRWICQIEAAEDLGRSSRVGYGTGCLIGRRTVLTAAHNLFVDDQRVSSFRLSFGTDGDRDHPKLGAYTTSTQEVHPDYLHHTVSPFDVAVIVLDAPLPADNVRGMGRQGWSEIQPGSLINEKAFISGYPVDRPHDPPPTIPANAHQFYHAEQISDHQGGQLFYPIDTSEGQSGSPILAAFATDSGQDTFAVGIHTHAADQRETNRGVAIQGSVADFIRKQIDKYETSPIT